jgi:hypothetical protein
MNPLMVRSQPTLIEGYAIASADSMIADAGGAMDALKDGSFWLVAWDERATASDSVQVTFGGQSRNYNLYDPTRALTPIGAGLAVLGLQVTLSDHPVIIQIL